MFLTCFPSSFGREGDSRAVATQYLSSESCMCNVVVVD